MAADYRFVGTNIDAILVTDATTGAKTFHVTELRGHDPADVMAGINYEVQAYHEADLIQMAMDLSLSLFRIDRVGEACLVLPGTPAGRFKGTTSFLTVDDVTLASSGTPALPITMGVTFRLTSEDFAALQSSCPPFHLFSSSKDQETAFSLDLFQGRTPLLGFAFVRGGRNVLTLEHTLPVGFEDMCWEVLVEISAAEEPGILDFRMFVNGDSVFETGTRDQTFAINDFDFTYGSQVAGSFNEISYSGVMRNLIITANGSDLVNIVDPSDGTNTGSEADGTPTDIDSITVIV